MEPEIDSREITAELTPNPNTLKFVLKKRLLDSGSCDFTDGEKAKESKLAAALFEIENVAGVLIGVNFVTVTKTPEAQWPEMARDVVECIKHFLSTGQSVVSENVFIAPEAPMSDMEREIRKILDEEIRPAVARDGGDIIFYGYEDGVVKLHLQGSCSSCPSSVLTLKFGIENRLKQTFPEIKEVLQV